MKAADISDSLFLTTVDNIQSEKGMRASRWDLEPYFPNVPEKVLRAKARKLILRKLLSGCSCGCRGDFEVTPLGTLRLALIKGERQKANKTVVLLTEGEK